MTFKILIKACQLCAWNYLGAVLPAVFMWMIIFTAVPALSSDPKLDTLLLALAGIILFLGLQAALLAFAFLIWSLFLKIFWSNPPAWLRVKWNSYFSDLLISALSTLPISVPITLYFWGMALRSARLGAITSYTVNYGTRAGEFVFYATFGLWWAWLLSCILVLLIFKKLRPS